MKDYQFIICQLTKHNTALQIKPLIKELTKMQVFVEDGKSDQANFIIALRGVQLCITHTYRSTWKKLLFYIILLTLRDTPEENSVIKWFFVKCQQISIESASTSSNGDVFARRASHNGALHALRHSSF